MAFLKRRAIFYLIALWASVSLNFLLPRVMPGDPISGIIAQYRQELRNNPGLLRSLRTVLGGSKDPLPVQYVHYLGGLLHGDLGVSSSHYPTPVSEVLREAVPWTLWLGVSSTLIAFLIGTLLGIVSSWRRNGVIDRVMTPLTMFAQSFPPFFIALLLAFYFGVLGPHFPSQGAFDVTTPTGLTWAYLSSVLMHSILPVTSVVIVNLGGWLLGMRNTMITTLTEEYVSLAEAKGLRDRRVMLRYAARNALLPQVTSFAISIGYIVAGLFLVEDVFSYPGVGYTLINAVQAKDFPLMQGLLLLISVAVLGANLLADVLYIRLDPRMTEV
jgi:peptide/nickel transport system permease protein